MNGQPGNSYESLGLTLIRGELITQDQWDRALEASGGDDRDAEQFLVREGWISEYQLTLFNGLHLGVSFLNVSRQEVQQEALEIVPEETARKHRVVPISVEDGVLKVAMEDPRNLEALEDLATVSLKRIEPYIGTPQEIQETIDRHYRVGGEIERQLGLIAAGEESEYSRGRAAARTSSEAIAQAPVVRALDLLMAQAVQDRASDIHIEPQEDRLRVRFRTDGILHEIMSLPLAAHAPILSRIKIMAGMNIAERRRPQDGQITFRTRDKEVDIRVATSNTIYGEMAVLRLLDKTFAFYTLPQLGFLPETFNAYMRMLKTPFGMILMSGPDRLKQDNHPVCLCSAAGQYRS